jgi:dTDP-4-dehydrorhamnose reductase
MFKKIIICCSLLVTCRISSLGQDSLKNVDISISEKERNTIIRTVLDSITRYYVSPEIAALMIKSIEQRKRKGIYKKINKGSVLSDALTRHLREISKDEHLTAVRNFRKRLFNLLT